MDASEAMEPLMPMKMTTAVSAQVGTFSTARRVAVCSSPLASVTPMAICMTSTMPSAAKPEKLETKDPRIHSRPSRVSRLCTATDSLVVGFTADTWSAEGRGERAPRSNPSHKNRMKGEGSALPTRSMVPRIPPVFFSCKLLPAKSIRSFLLAHRPPGQMYAHYHKNTRSFRYFMSNSKSGA